MATTNGNPGRVQLRRTKGWRMPADTVKVDRSTVFGNPFVASGDFTALDAYGLFRKWLYADRDTLARYPELHGRRHALLVNLPRLKGKNLACWCKPTQPCHADLLLQWLKQQDTMNGHGNG